MKPKLNAVIIGAGGVTSYMLPALKNSFDLSVSIFDGDKLEKHNLDRQLFRNNQVGSYKAEALLKLYTFRKADGIAVCEYFTPELLETEYKQLFSIADIIICAVDNHPARKAAIEAADQFNTPIVVCANEYHTSQSYYYDPKYNQSHPNMHPFRRYPTIKTDRSGSPVSCQGLALESDPQLAIANQVAASFGNYLMWLWHGSMKDEANQDITLEYTPVEFQSTFSRIQTYTMDDIQKMEVRTNESSN